MNVSQSSRTAKGSKQQPPMTGKRPRTSDDDEEIHCHVSSTDNDVEDDPISKVARLPERKIASSLAKYLEPGGWERFRPRDEWLLEVPKEYDRVRLITRPGIREQTPRPLVSHYNHYMYHLRVQLLKGLIRHHNVVGKAVEVDEQNEGDVSSSELKPVLFGPDWDSALIVAIRRENDEAAMDLIRHGAPVNSMNGKGTTPLILAAQRGSMPLVSFLLEAGASLFVLSLSGVSALMQAAHFGHARVVETLLRASKSLLEEANFNQTTPLMRAAQEGHINVVKVLLKSGAQVNRRNQSRLTPLMLAAQRGHNAVVSMLIDAGAEVNAVTAQNSTALMLATKRNHDEVVRTLVEAGCEMWVKVCTGTDTLMLIGLAKKSCLHCLNLTNRMQEVALPEHWHLSIPSRKR